MSIFDYMKKLSSTISDKLTNEKEKINPSKTFNIITEAIGNSYKTYRYITNFPQIEFIARKEPSNDKPLTIDYYSKKYVIDKLDEIINSMSNQEKSIFYRYLGNKSNKTIGLFCSNNKKEITYKYYEKALSYSSDNIDIAYDFFQAYSIHCDFIIPKRAVEIGELCIKLSNNIDTKDKFSDIYYLIGKYCNDSYNKEYEKAIDSFKKSIQYSKLDEKRKSYIYEELAKAYENFGDYKNALNTYCYIKELTKDNDSFHQLENISTAINRLKRYIEENITKDDIDRENYISDIKYTFRNSVDLYPIEKLEKAYEKYLYAQKLVKQGKRSEAIKEYEELKDILPSEFNLFDRFVCIHKTIERDEGIEKRQVINLKNKPNNISISSKNLFYEHLKKGNTAFNNGIYDEAIHEYKAAFEKNGKNLDVFFSEILAMNIYSTNHSEEFELGMTFLDKSFINNSFKYLPFIYTICGDAEAYQNCEKNDIVTEYYEIAICLLNMVSEKDRFAAPYYKLARIREAKKMYKEALELLMQVKKIDSSYMIDDDIKRIKMILENTDRFKNIATNQINAIKRYENSKNNNEEIFKECKEALKFVPNNTEILYLFSKAASNLNLFYEFKWAIKEYTRVCHSEYDKEIYYYYLIISLGKICKYEKKYEEAKYYFGLIVHDEDIENNAMYFEASEEYKACEALLNNYND